MPVHPELSERPLPPHPRRRRPDRPGRIALATVLLLMVTLAACTDGGGNPQLDPTVSASSTAPPTSPTLSPSPTRTGPLLTGPNVRPGEKPPTLPSYAQTHDLSAALYFANYYFQAFDWSIATNDGFLLRQISASSCQACSRALDGIELLRRSQRTLLGGRISVVRNELDSRKFTISADYAFQVQTRESAQKTIDSAGRVVSSQRASTDTSIVFVSWVKRGWQVREVTVSS